MSRILIVDDDRNTTRMLRTILEMDGFAVATVERGEQVIPTAQDFRPDIILLDYYLADMVGTDLVQTLRAHPGRLATVPVIITSGRDVEDEVLAAGANAFLVKPFEPGDLPDLFKRLIE